jgi:hypothetical protein
MGRYTRKRKLHGRLRRLMLPQHHRQLDQAVRDFRARDLRDPAVGNRFFERWGVGNRPDRPDAPFERFEYYRQLLIRLKMTDPLKFQQIHKGTPYFFLAWTAFDLGDYDRALFFLDAAVAEDMRIDPNGWRNAPACQTLRLEMPPRHVAGRHIPELRNRIENQVRRFRGVAEPGHNLLADTDALVTRFVDHVLAAGDPRVRNVVSALYVWVFQFEDLYARLVLRGDLTSSLLPIAFHLLSGGVIFETILQLHFPGNTLERVFSSKRFSNAFPGVRPTVGAVSWQATRNSMRDQTLQTAFSVTGKLRNLLAHSLTRVDGLGGPEEYRAYFEQEVNSVLYLVSVVY